MIGTDYQIEQMGLILPRSSTECCHHSGQHVPDESEWVLAGECNIETNERETEMHTETGDHSEDEHAHHSTSFGQIFDGQNVGHYEKENTNGRIPKANRIDTPILE